MIAGSWLHVMLKFWARLWGRAKNGQPTAKGSNGKMKRNLDWAFSSIVAGPDLGRVPLDCDRRDTPSLVYGGRSAGQTRVKYRARKLQMHLFVRGKRSLCDGGHTAKLAWRFRR